MPYFRYQMLLEQHKERQAQLEEQDERREFMFVNRNIQVEKDTF